MVYMTYEDLNWRPIVQSWIVTYFRSQVNEETGVGLLPQELLDELFELFETYIDPCLKLIRTKLSELIVTADVQLVRSLLNLLEAFISKEFGLDQKANIDDQRRFLHYTFAFAFAWSMCATIDPTE